MVVVIVGLRSEVAQASGVAIETSSAGIGEKKRRTRRVVNIEASLMAAAMAQVSAWAPQGLRKLASVDPDIVGITEMTRQRMLQGRANNQYCFLCGTYQAD